MAAVLRTKKRVLVVGLGETGLSCARFLAAQGCEVAVADSRDIPPGLDRIRTELPDIALFLGPFEERVFASAEQLIVSPGVSLKEPVIQQAAAKGIPVLGDIELFAQANSVPVIAITGSNGKSTVTSMVESILRAAQLSVHMGGNIGIPALDLLSLPQPDYYVLELSSFQLEYTHSLNAVAAAVLNISPDHMDRYSDLREYADAKQKIYHGNGTMVLNRDDPVVANMFVETRNTLGYSLIHNHGDDFCLQVIDGEAHLCRGDQPIMACSELKVFGRHNVANALAAMALCESVGIPHSAMRSGLATFTGLPHRSQWVAEKNGIHWFNDSKGTNVGATEAALNGMDPPVILIAGGDSKGGDFTALRDVVAKKTRAVVLIGQDAQKIAEAFQGATTLAFATDMADAVATANNLAHTGDCVLLSPACASFDMFKNYEHRGDVFVGEVKKL